MKTLNKFGIHLLLLCLITLSVNSCSTKGVSKFPDADIVFEANQEGKAALGFINSNGSQLSILTTEFYVTQPSWSKDGNFLFFYIYPGDIGGVHHDPGILSNLQNGGNLRRCMNFAIINTLISPTNLPKEVIAADSLSITRIDIQNCREIDKLVDYFESDKTEKFKTNIVSASISDDGNTLVYSVHELDIKDYSERFLTKMVDLNTKGTKDIREGINGSLSPDNQWIAYTWFDGIYVVKADQSEIKHLVNFTVGNSLYPDDFPKAAPYPHWSPDSQWLVYHRCETGICDQIKDFSIFKVRISNGEFHKLTEGGIYPYWRIH